MRLRPIVEQRRPGRSQQDRLTKALQRCGPVRRLRVLHGGRLQSLRFDQIGGEFGVVGDVCFRHSMSQNYAP